MGYRFYFKVFFIFFVLFLTFLLLYFSYFRDSSRPLTLVMSREPRMLQFALYDTMATSLVKKALFRSLIEYDDKLNPYPELAEYVPSLENGKVRILDNGKMRVYWKLRKNLKWSDGKALTTEDILFTYRVLQSSKIASYSIERYDAKFIEKIEIIDENSFVVVWKKPYFRFLINVQIYPRHLLEKDFLNDPSNLKNNKLNTMPVGNGPFILKKWKKGEYLLLERNNFFHKPVQLDSIAFQIIRNSHSAIIHLLSGQGDIVMVLSPDQMNFLLNEYFDRVRTVRVSGMGWMHIDFNLDNFILKNNNIRKAMFYAINRKVILEQVLYNYYNISDSWLPDRHYGYFKSDFSYDYDIKKSENILRVEGWVKNENGYLMKDGKIFSISMFVGSGNNIRVRIASLIREDFRKVGILLKLYFQPVSTFLSKFMARGNFDLALYSWYMSSLIDGRDYWHSDNIPSKESNFAGFNFARFNNSLIDDIHDKLVGTLFLKKRLKLFRRHQEIWMDILPAIPLFISSSLNAVSKNLKNYRPTGSSVPDTWNCENWYFD